MVLPVESTTKTLPDFENRIATSVSSGEGNTHDLSKSLTVVTSFRFLVFIHPRCLRFQSGEMCRFAAAKFGEGSRSGQPSSHFEVAKAIYRWKSWLLPSNHGLGSRPLTESVIIARKCGRFAGSALNADRTGQGTRRESALPSTGTLFESGRPGRDLSTMTHTVGIPDPFPLWIKSRI